MTQSSIFDLPPSSVDAPVYRSPQGERSGKKTRTELVIDYFVAHPHEWIDGMVFAEFAGQYAWRSRIADARKRGMTIENRQRTERDHAFTCPGLGAWDIPEACNCGRRRVYVVSEYRYVPSSSSPTGKPRT